MLKLLLFVAVLAFAYPLHAQTCGGTFTTLLHIIYGGPYAEPTIPGQYLGDSTQFAENRFVVHKDIPSTYNGRGGISFNPGVDAFVAVNDGFMAGLVNFELSFFFYVATDNPTTGTLAGSNWATPNNGDWLLQFNGSGKLSLMIQHNNVTTNTAGTMSFVGNTEYRVRMIKEGTSMKIYVNDNLQIDTTAPNPWPENGSPLAFGGNAYDRIGGMDYFKGTIGQIKIVKWE